MGDIVNKARRNTLQFLSYSAASLAIPSLAAGHVVGGQKPVKLGLITDIHIGLSPNADQRLKAFVKAMKAESLDAIVQLGDFAFPNAKHQSAPDLFNACHEKALHVIGNHDLDHNLTRKDCMKAWRMPAPFYAQDIGGIRLLVLDGNDQGSPKHKGGYPIFVGRKQMEWLAKELDKSDRPLVIASHQPLAGPSEVDNAMEIQKLLSRYQEKILICINGHTHIDKLVEREDIRYLHVNSASYFWMGGKVRMAHYKEPLFAVLTIDPENRQITVKGKTSSWVTKSPEEHGYFSANKHKAELREAITPQIRSRMI